MQFLVYLTVLMVAVGTVLVEVHWLTSPDPRINPTVQTRAVQASKAGGSNAGVRTVYPDASRSQGTDSQVQTADTRQGTGMTNTAVQPPSQATISPSAHLPPGTSPASTPQDSPSKQSMPAAPVPPQQPLAAPSTQSAAAPQPSAQQSRTETTDEALRDENRRSSSGADNSLQPQVTIGPSANRCDILACAGTYRSFRANDCTYQPVDGGARRLCEKSAGQRIVREREQPNRGRVNRDIAVHNADRAGIRPRFVDENDDAVDADDFIREPTGFLDFILLGRRPR